MKSWQKVAYSFGALGLVLSFQVFNSRLQFLYLDEIGITPAVFGAILVVYGLWNAINDPLMGQLSDNTRSGSGRRIPYIRWATLPMALFFMLLWIPPRQAPTGLLIAYLVVMIFAFDTLWTLVVIAWTALFPEMYPDLRDRAAVSGLRQVFSILGLIGALVLGPILIDRVGYLGMGLLLGAVTAASFYISLLGSRENPALHKDAEGLPLLEAVRASLANRSFRWFLLANLAKEFTFLIMTASLPFYAKYVIRLRDIPGGLDAPTQESLLLGVPFLLSIPMMAVWTRITQRVGSRRAWIYAALAFIPGLLLVFFASNFMTAIAGTTLLALGLPGLLMLADLLIADVIDEDELNIGHRREGMYFGMNGAIIRLAYSAQGLLTTTVLTLTHYQANLDVQPVEAVWGFRALMAGGPILGALLTILALRFYPLHGARLSEMHEKVAEMHRNRETVASPG